mmetsp:Transcript_115191/g.366064  ORF Transcript_115191/g.366064 Transcript_115191/m.366064 type:complete len:202 (-) Transcript_115191:45-650(-)
MKYLPSSSRSSSCSQRPLKRAARKESSTAHSVLRRRCTTRSPPKFSESTSLRRASGACMRAFSSSNSRRSACKSSRAMSIEARTSAHCRSKSSRSCLDCSRTASASCSLRAASRKRVSMAAKSPSALPRKACRPAKSPPPTPPPIAPPHRPPTAPASVAKASLGIDVPNADAPGKGRKEAAGPSGVACWPLQSMAPAGNDT